LDRDAVDGVVINDRVVFAHEYAFVRIKNISDLVPHCDKVLRSLWSDRQSDIE